MDLERLLLFSRESESKSSHTVPFRATLKPSEFGFLLQEWSSGDYVQTRENLNVGEMTTPCVERQAVTEGDGIPRGLCLFYSGTHLSLGMHHPLPAHLKKTPQKFRAYGFSLIKQHLPSKA